MIIIMRPIGFMSHVPLRVGGCVHAGLRSWAHFLSYGAWSGLTSGPESLGLSFSRGGQCQPLLLSSDRSLSITSLLGVSTLTHMQKPSASKTVTFLPCFCSTCWRTALEITDSLSLTSLFLSHFLLPLIRHICKVKLHFSNSPVGLWFTW